jgi:hypothetical protein
MGEHDPAEKYKWETPSKSEFVSRHGMAGRCQEAVSRLRSAKNRERENEIDYPARSPTKFEIRFRAMKTIWAGSRRYL